MKLLGLVPVAVIVLGAVLSTGCRIDKLRDHGYARPYTFDNPKYVKHDFKSCAFRTNYDSLMVQSRTNSDTNAVAKLRENAKDERNAILGELIYLIDASHGEYERNVRVGKSSLDLLGDLAILGVNSAGAIVGAAETKTILHVISGGIEGSQLAVNKRMLQDQALEAVQAQMRASMKDHKADIINCMKNNIQDYPLEMGLSDIVQYYYDGTITRALQNMAQSAKKQENDADKKVYNAKIPPTQQINTNTPSSK